MMFTRCKTAFISLCATFLCATLSAQEPTAFEVQMNVYEGFRSAPSGVYASACPTADAPPLGTERERASIQNVYGLSEVLQIASSAFVAAKNSSVTLPITCVSDGKPSRLEVQVRPSAGEDRTLHIRMLYNNAEIMATGADAPTGKTLSFGAKADGRQFYVLITLSPAKGAPQPPKGSISLSAPSYPPEAKAKGTVVLELGAGSPKVLSGAAPQTLVNIAVESAGKWRATGRHIAFVHFR